MKKINYDALVNAVISKKSYQPILTHAKVENGTMYATDLETSIKVKSSLPDGMYQLIGKQWIRKNNIDIEDYPLFPELVLDNSIMLPAEALLNAKVFASKDITRPLMCQVFAGIDKITQEFNVVSTDGHRMFKRTLDAPHNFHDDITLFVDQKVIDLIKKAGVKEVEYGYSTERTEEKIKGIKNEETIHVTYSNTHGMIRFEGCEIYYKMCVGKYPNYNQVIPSSLSQAFKFDTKEMLKPLKELLPLVKLVSDKDAPVIRFNIEEDKMVFFIKDAGEGIDEKRTVSISRFEGGILNTDNVIVLMPVKVKSEDCTAFDIKYFIDVLSVLSDNSYCYFNNNLKPFVFANEDIITGALPVIEQKEEEAA
jgi:hypothetical protein